MKSTLMQGVTAALISLALLFVLCRSVAYEYSTAALAVLRNAAASEVPVKVRLEADAKHIEEAEQVARDLAGTVRELDGEIQEGEDQIARLKQRDAVDKETLSRIHGEIKCLPPGGIVTIAGIRFELADLERDGEKILERVKRSQQETDSRQKLIDALRTQRANQTQLMSIWSNRIGELKLGTVEAEGHIQEIRFAQRISGAAADGKSVLARAEEEQQQLLRDLRVEANTAKAMTGIQMRSPVEEALDAGDDKSKSVADRIAGALE